MGYSIGTLSASIGLDNRPFVVAAAKVNQTINAMGDNFDKAQKKIGGFGSRLEQGQAKLRGVAGGAAKLTTVVGELSGTFAGAGVEANKINKALSLMQGVALGGIGPVGALAIAVGALAAAWLSAAKAEKKYQDAANATSDSLIARLKQTGANTEAEKDLLKARIESIKGELLLARGRQALLQTEQAQLGFFEKLGVGIKATAGTLLQGGGLIDAAKEFNAQSDKITKAKTADEMAKLALQIDELGATMEDANLALNGGTDALNEAKEATAAAAKAAEEHAKMLAEQAAALQASEDRIRGYGAALKNAQLEAVDAQLGGAGSLEEVARLSEEKTKLQLQLLDDELAARKRVIEESTLAEEQKIKETLALEAAFQAERVNLEHAGLQERTDALKAFYDEDAAARTAALEYEAEQLEAAKEKAEERFAGLRTVSQSLLDAFRSDWTNFGDFLSNFWDSLLQKLTASASTELDSIFTNLAAGLAKGAGTGGVNLADPNTFIGPTQFAVGGIVTRPTLGLVGERGPEAVIPLNSPGGMAAVQGMGGGARGSGRPVSVVIQTPNPRSFTESTGHIMARMAQAMRAADEREN